MALILPQKTYKKLQQLHQDLNNRLIIKCANLDAVCIVLKT